MDPLSIASGATALVTTCVKISAALYTFLDDIRQADSNVASLCDEVNGLSRALDAISKAWATNPRIIMAQGQDTLWLSVRMSLDECGNTLERLTTIVHELDDNGGFLAKGFLRKPNKQVRLNLRLGDISTIRQQISSHNQAMQSSLLMINVSLSLQSNASEELVVRQLSELRDLILRMHMTLQQSSAHPSFMSGETKRLSQNLQQFLQHAESFHSNATTVVGQRSTVWGGSVANYPLSSHQRNNITQWISPPVMEELGLNASRSSTTGHDSVTGTSDGLNAGQPEGSDSEPDVEQDLALAVQCEKLALNNLDNQNHHKAEVFLRKLLDKWGHSLVLHGLRKPVYLDSIRILLTQTLCFQSKWGDAEYVLSPVVRSKSQLSPEALHLLHTISLAYSAEERLDRAAKCCRLEVSARKKSLGKSDPSTYEAITLLVKVLDSQGDVAEAESWRAFLPTQLPLFDFEPLGYLSKCPPTHAIAALMAPPEQSSVNEHSQKDHQASPTPSDSSPEKRFQQDRSDVDLTEAESPLGILPNPSDRDQSSLHRDVVASVPPQSVTSPPNQDIHLPPVSNSQRADDNPNDPMEEKIQESKFATDILRSSVSLKPSSDQISEAKDGSLTSSLATHTSAISAAMKPKKIDPLAPPTRPLTHDNLQNLPSDLLESRSSSLSAQAAGSTNVEPKIQNISAKQSSKLAQILKFWKRNEGQEQKQKKMGSQSHEWETSASLVGNQEDNNESSSFRYDPHDGLSSLRDQQNSWKRKWAHTVEEYWDEGVREVPQQVNLLQKFQSVQSAVYELDGIELHVSPEKQQKTSKKAATPALLEYSPTQLVCFDGKFSDQILIAVRGDVYDVSASRDIFGLGGLYSAVAGHDATRSFACGIYDGTKLTEDLNGPLDSLDDLSEEEIHTLNTIEGLLRRQYKVVGKLVPVVELPKTHVLSPDPQNTTDPRTPKEKPKVIIGLDLGISVSVAALWLDQLSDVQVITSWPGSSNSTVINVPTSLSYDSSGVVTRWGWDDSRVSPQDQKAELFKLAIMRGRGSKPNSYILKGISPLGPLGEVEEKVITIPELKKEPLIVLSDYLFHVRHGIQQFLCNNFAFGDILSSLHNRIQRNTKIIFTIPPEMGDELTFRSAIEAAGFGPLYCLVSEPKAAALYAHTKGFLELSLKDALVVVNAGEITVEVVVYYVKGLEPLCFSYNVNGVLAPYFIDACGHSFITNAFSTLVRSRLSSLYRFEDSGPKDQDSKAYSKCMRNFQDVILPSFTNNGISWPVELGVDIEDPLAGVTEGYIIFTNKDIESCFSPVLQTALELIGTEISIIRKSSVPLHKIHVLMVGTFPTYEYFYNETKTYIKTNHGPSVQVVRPKDCATAIAQGAVLAGLNDVFLGHEHSTPNLLNFT